MIIIISSHSICTESKKFLNKWKICDKFKLKLALKKKYHLKKFHYICFEIAQYYEINEDGDLDKEKKKIIMKFLCLGDYE